MYTTLNSVWAMYGGQHPTWYQLCIRYLIVLFGPLETLSAAPLRAVSLASNLSPLLTGTELDERLGTRRLVCFLMALSMPFLIAIPCPSVSNTLAGLGVLTVVWQYDFPILFIMIAARKVRETFGGDHFSRNAYQMPYSFPAFHQAYACICVVITVFEIVSVIGQYRS